MFALCVRVIHNTGKFIETITIPLSNAFCKSYKQ